MNINKEGIYQFKYEGDFTSLDALTVLNSQLNFITILNEVRVQKFPEIKLDIKIKGVEKGSLDIQHFIDVAAISGMFVMENYSYTQTVFKIFGDIIKLKKFLKAKKADDVKEAKGDTVNVYLQGDNITVHPDAFKIYQNSQVVTTAIGNTSRLLSGNDDIKFIEVTETKKSKSLLKINKFDLPALSESNPYLDHKIDEQLYKGQVLFVKEPNLFPPLQKGKKWVWKLIHQGRDIKGIIVDEKFQREINDGRKLGQGDRLKADLKVFFKYDERLNTYVESQKYEVSNIVEIIDRKDGFKLDFGTN